MARRYTDEEKAKVYVTLAANGGNIKRTSVETGVNRSTIHSWVKEWETSGLPDEVKQHVGESSVDYIAAAERIRDKALNELERRIDDGDMNGRELGTIFGILDDKIARARGLPTARTSVSHELPSPQEAAELMRGFITGAITAANERAEEVAFVEAEIVEPAALPHSTNPTEE